MLQDLFPWSRVISLHGQTFRQENVRQQFTSHGWRVPEFYMSYRDNDNPGRGCYMSHVGCMKMALEQGAPYALVFEDDVVFSSTVTDSDIRNIERELEKTLKNKGEWDIILLGYCGSDYNDACTRFDTYKDMRHIKKSKCMCLHAVVYNTPFMERFVKNHSVYPGYEIDDIMFYSIPDLKMLVIKPQLFLQNLQLPSTITDKNIPRMQGDPYENRETTTFNRVLIIMLIVIVATIILLMATRFKQRR